MLKKMKLYLLLIICVSVGFAKVPKKPLWEVFTGSYCGGCSFSNEYLSLLLNSEKNKDKFSLVKYQCAPDPYATNEGKAKYDFYSVDKIPTLFINGETKTKLHNKVTQGILDSICNEQTNLELLASAKVGNDSVVTVTITIKPLQNYPPGLVLNTILVEQVTTKNIGSNDETYFNNVMMKQLPDQNGIKLDSLKKDEFKTYTFTVNTNKTKIETLHDLEIVTFIQDVTTKEIIQSETALVDNSIEAFSLTFDIKDSLNSSIDSVVVLINEIGVKYSESQGSVVFTNLQGNHIYSYKVMKRGYVTQHGVVSLQEDDYSKEIILEKPDYLFFENFSFIANTNPLPDNWIKIGLVADKVGVTNEKLWLYKFFTDTAEVVGVTIPIDSLCLSDSIQLDVSSDYFSTPIKKELTVITSKEPDSINTNIIFSTKLKPGDNTIGFSYPNLPQGHKYLHFIYRTNETAQTLIQLDNIACIKKETSSKLSHQISPLSNKKYTLSTQGDLMYVYSKENFSAHLYTVDGKLLTSSHQRKSAIFDMSSFSQKIFFIAIQENSACFIEKIVK